MNENQSINEEITRLENAKEDLKDAIESKGVDVGDGTLDTYAAKVAAIPRGSNTEFISGLFVFDAHQAGDYIVYCGNNGQDITNKGYLQFKGVSSQSTTFSMTEYQYGYIHYLKDYSQASSQEVFAKMIAIGMDVYGNVYNTVFNVISLASGYRVQFNKVHQTNNMSPIGKLIKIYDQYNGTYAVNDLVIREDGGFYKCVTAVTTPESFDSSKWTWAPSIDTYIRSMLPNITYTTIDPGAGSPLAEGTIVFVYE